MYALESSQGAAVFVDGKSRLRLTFVTPSIARITLTEGKPFGAKPSLIVTSPASFAGFQVDDTGDAFKVSTAALSLLVDRQTGAIRYLDSAGATLLREPERGGKTLVPKKVTRNVFKQGGRISSVQSIDGARAAAVDFETVFDRDAFDALLEFEFADGEAIFGLGSHEEGYGNLRGKSRDLYQQNRKIALPSFVSTRGYGILVDCCSLMTFRDGPSGACLRADTVDELDYYFIGGGDFDAVARGYRELTGPAPMLPKWAFGFLQSKERYVNARELLEIVREHRRRAIPLDAIILDWKSWPNGGGWGQKSFDPSRFPDPDALTRELHRLGARLMVSIWPLMTGGCADQKELAERGLMLGDGSTYNAFLSEARGRYWDQADRGLFAHGVDAWWCDCTEPFEADWKGAGEPSPAERLATNTGESAKYLDRGLINAYSLVHSQGIYEGQRRASSAKRVLNLTRSSYAGQHRYATVSWNGDLSSTWETLRRCIPEGLNFCAAGEPYWTVDIGGFFVASNPDLWFWRGDYPEGCRGLADMNAVEPDPNDAGCRDLGFHELYVRWMQYAAFLPMFRSHGTDAAREIWRFGEPDNPFYDAIAGAIRLRYRLMPYVYSLAAQVTLHGRAMLRAVALDYPSDARTHDLTDQFLFGPSLLVCPVTQPMLYGPGSRQLPGLPKNRLAYLPAGNRWYDFWTEAVHDGGQTVAADAPLDRIPLFVRAGAILPMTEPTQHVDEAPDAPYEIRVYRGADGEFSLYEDAGDGYEYEHGAFALVRLVWNEERRTLTISERMGSYPGMVAERRFDVVFISGDGREVRTIRYTGEPVQIQPLHPI